MTERDLRRFVIAGGIGILGSSVLAGTATATFDLPAAYSVAFLVPGIAVVLFGAYAYGIQTDRDIVDPAEYARRGRGEQFIDFAAVATASTLTAFVLTALAIEFDLLVADSLTGEILSVETVTSILVMCFGFFAGLYAGVVRIRDEPVTEAK